MRLWGGRAYVLQSAKGPEVSMHPWRHVETLTVWAWVAPRREARAMERSTNCIGWLVGWLVVAVKQRGCEELRWVRMDAGWPIAVL